MKKIYINESQLGVINDFINNKINKEFTKYKSVLQSLYVTKINKRQPKEYTQINYQVLNLLLI